QKPCDRSSSTSRAGTSTLLASPRRMRSTYRHLTTAVATTEAETTAAATTAAVTAAVTAAATTVEATAAATTVEVMAAATTTPPETSSKACAPAHRSTPATAIRAVARV